MKLVDLHNHTTRNVPETMRKMADDMERRGATTCVVIAEDEDGELSVYSCGQKQSASEAYMLLGRAKMYLLDLEEGY